MIRPIPKVKGRTKITDRKPFLDWYSWKSKNTGLEIFTAPSERYKKRKN